MKVSTNKSSGHPVVELSKAEQFNYSLQEYAGRLLWRLCWLSLWQLCWRRLYALRVLLLKCFGAKLSFKNQFAASSWIEIPWNLKLGEYSSIGPRVHLYNLGPTTIGSNTVISQDAYLCGGTHDYTVTTMPLIKSAITIGDNVWICAGAFIGPGISIGDGAVIGARAVVTKDVEPWTVVAGNPAVVINRRHLKE
jgi:putative colanic acid biosynthesis acetyltransferase WcaF